MEPSLPFGSGAVVCGRQSLLVIDDWTLFWLVIMTLFCGLGTDVHFSGDESGMQWEDYLFELQNAVEWRMVMSRGADERAQMHAMSMLLTACEGMADRALIAGGNWIQQGSESSGTERLV